MEQKQGASSQGGDRDDQQQPLEKYRIILAYHAYEGQVYWSRSQLFLVASAALFGFVSTRLSSIWEPSKWNELGVAFAGCVAGIFLAILWRRALAAGEFWLDRWETCLRELEPIAFGGREVMRNPKQRKDGPPQVNARAVARNTVSLFIGLWVAALCWVVAAGVMERCRFLEEGRQTDHAAQS